MGYTPVVPTAQEAEAGGPLELGRLRLQSAVIVSLHSSLGDRVKPFFSYKKVKSYKQEMKAIEEKGLLNCLRIIH